MNQSNSIPVGDGAKSSYSAPEKNIVDTIIAANALTAFSACIRVAGLTDTLSARGPYTVFAPSDEAFRKLPTGAYNALLKDPAKLRAILSYYVVTGYLMTRDLKSVEMMTLQGTKLTVAVSSVDVRINGACMVQADTAATNGVVHIIDTVMLPKGWQLPASAI